MGTWYIAKTGNDSSGNGSAGSPWKTLNKAVAAVPAGTQASPSVIIVKNGTYNLKSGEGLQPGKKKINLDKAWMIIRAETTHGAILHGDMTPGPPLRPDASDKNYIGSGAGGAGSDFLSIEANGVTIDGLVIECIGGAAIGVGAANKLPDDITVQNNITYWTMGQGINVTGPGKTGSPAKTGARTVVRNNRVCCASVRSITAEPPGDTPDPSTGAIRIGYMMSGLVENNTIDHCFGEGMDVGKFNHGTADNPTIIRNNIVRDTSHVALYLLWSRYVHVYGNIVYHTKNSGAHQSQSPWGPGNCLTFRDEKAGTPTGNYGAATGEDYYVYNNVLVNGDTLFQHGKQKRIYFGFNTLVTGYYTYNAGVISSGEASGIFENNIIVDATTQRRPSPASGYQGDFRLAAASFSVTRPNAWSYPPPPAWQRAGDVYGATGAGGSAEAKKLGLVNPTRDLVTTGWGWNYATFADFDAAVSDNFDVTDYHLTANSPARNKAGARLSANGITVPVLPFQTDYRGATRSQPDMGWHEASGQVEVHVEADFSATPGGTELETGTNVAYTNESVVTGTTATGYLWTVKKGAATQTTATTTHFSYTFPTAGSYTVALEVQTPEGNDSHTVAYTITDPVATPTVDAVIGRTPSGVNHQAGTTITFSDNSTFHLCSFTSRLWEVKTSPGGVLVASSTAASWGHQFATAGTFTVKLTENASGGLTDSQTLTYTITATAPTVTASFTASDADLTVTAGTEIDFTNTSTASGTTITANTWSVARRGSGVDELFSSADLSYTFNEAGLWDVALRVDTAAGVVDATTVAVTVQPVGGGGGFDFAAVPKLFALATALGVQTVTAAALGTTVPVGVHLKVVGATVDGTAATGGLWSEGAAATGAQWAHARFSAHGQATSVAKRARSSNDLFLILDGSSIVGRGTFVRFVPGGMEIDITDAPPGAYLAEATFYAGETCLFRAGEFIPGTVDTDTRVETGIDADVLYVMSGWAAEDSVMESGADMSRGWATRDLTQLHLRNADRDALGTTAAVTRYLNSRIGSSENGAGWYTSLQVTAMDATGFTLKPRGSSLFRPAGYFVFATGGPAVHLSGETLATASPSEHPLPFEAQTVMALTSTMRSENSQEGGVDAVGQGWWVNSIHGTVNQSLSLAQAVGADTSATRSLSASGFRAVNHDGGNVWNSPGAVDANGVSLTWTAAPVAAYRMILLAVEVGEESVVSDLPIARFEVEFDIDPRSGRVAAWFDPSTSSGNGEEITGYWWEFGDGATAAEENPFHLYEAIGVYDVALTVTTAAGSDTITKTALVAVAPRTGVDQVLTMSFPLTSGGETVNAYDDNWDHAHAIRFDPVAHFRALRGEEVTAFINAPADEVYALVAYDQDGNRFLIKETNGTVRVVATTVM